MAKIKSDIEIARKAKMKPINKILAKINVPDKSSAFSPMGRHIAKINFEFLNKLKKKKDGNLILVTAITPTPAGEGKTTTSVGLNDGLNRIGRKSIVCLREPSLGPSFGMKGGAAGGGYAQVVPMEQINLHFTGDFHAITSAHNLLSAMIDNHIYWGNKLDIDENRIVWKRVMDMNDRALRFIDINTNGSSHPPQAPKPPRRCPGPFFPSPSTPVLREQRRRHSLLWVAVAAVVLLDKAPGAGGRRSML